MTASVRNQSLIAIVDVDETLLDWKPMLHKWLRDTGLDALNLEKEVIIKAFTQSILYGRLPAVRGAKQGIEYLRNAGASINICTAASNHPLSIISRIQNLENEFGKVFNNYSFCNHSDDVESIRLDYIRSFDSKDQTNRIIFIDDKFSNIAYAVRGGIDPADCFMFTKDRQISNLNKIYLDSIGVSWGNWQDFIDKEHI